MKLHIDFIIEWLMANATEIEAAAHTLGIEPEAAIELAVRRALRLRAADTHQLKLFDQETDNA